MSVIVFWIVAGTLGLAVSGILLRSLATGPAAAEPATAHDLGVYRDQLREVERDLARGVIAPEEADRLRAEVSRRVLDADRAQRRGETPETAPSGAGWLAGGFVLAMLAASGWGYWHLGAPGYPDLPLKTRIELADERRANRPSQAEAEADFAGAQTGAVDLPVGAEPEFLALMDRLREAVRLRPADLQGQQLLARNEAALENFAAAAAAQRQVIALKAPNDSAADHSALAELLVVAAGGYVSPEAEAALTEALRRDPQDGMALYYSGAMLAQVGRPDQAFPLWRQLLENSAPGDPWVPALRAQIGALAFAAGVAYELPPEMPGPTADDMNAAAGMSEADRRVMIEGMVAQLNERLATEGGTAEEWARLIGAYGVLGEQDRAAAIHAEAVTRFAGREADLALIDAAARQAGALAP